MSIHPFLDMDGASERPSGNSRGDMSTENRTYKCSAQPQTPPGSTSGSPRVKIEDHLRTNTNSQEFNNFPQLQNLVLPPGSLPAKLPSLGEFDEGVESLVRAHGPVSAWNPPSPFPGLPRNPTILEPLQSITQPQPSWSLKDRSAEDLARDHPVSRRETITASGQFAPGIKYSRHGSYGNSDAYYGYAASSPSLQGLPVMDCYPSPPPESEIRHINQKYTTEEGDFIIYACHDQKMKWQRIKQEFATRFGRIPERTVQGLQAWYYRMNMRIPIWDQDGWLCFDNEDDLEPRYVGVKCRDRDSQDKPAEPLGLAQRYPERAVNYPWVDPETKLKARDWAGKRALQYRERRERRRRKEQRRLKL
ncbi:hypothetical protein FSARC_8717 [Fusarium sarcochroum]|uniref:Uncharacterized protein n=1 Tax=Fusarium sarcochroum TaxID=1208366 RepID=A0A8H4TSR3_9HYPO|nr:hypothetical protein FSARC_8717 [Fusarium sarcochroum]